MPKKISNIRGLKKGDLVTHVLYGREWVGVLMEILSEENGLTAPRELGLVKMHPGTDYEFFFKTNVSKKYRVSDTIGYVSLNWLFKLEKR